MALIADVVFDAAITVLTTNTNVLYITSTEYATYAEASSTKKLGTKSSYSLGAVGNGTPSGRKTTAPAISDGVVNTTGSASHWALCSGTVLYATGALSAPQGVTSGNTFTLTAFDVTIIDAVSA